MVPVDAISPTVSKGHSRIHAYPGQNPGLLDALGFDGLSLQPARQSVMYTTIQINHPQT